jgi:spermidine/putrescine-binding protein
VPVWYTSGDQSEQVLRDGEVVMGQVWSGRAYNVLDSGVDLEIVWDRAIYEPGFWFAFEGAPHQEAAFQFLQWVAANAEAQAGWATEMSYGPANPDAFNFMEEDVATRLADYPANFEKLVVPDWQWYAENFEEIQQRWNEFLAG